MPSSDNLTASAPRDSRFAAGTQLGSYVISERLGAGGMGEVYRARDVRLERDVALKVLPEAMARDPQALARFEREARAVAALCHPNVRGIYDLGREGHTVFAVMELLDGESLRERLAGGALPLRKALEIAVAAAQGLAAAHEKGIIHRDIKPENLFLTRDGHVKILDFGLARPLPDPRRTEAMEPPEGFDTAPGTVIGTAHYMSPEQLSGEAVDTRADIFAFGGVLHEMLSGEHPFLGSSTHEVMLAILRDEPRDLRAAVPPIPAEVARIVQHCLEKSPERRFQSARDLAFALSDQPATITGQRIPPEAAKHGGRLRGAAWLATGLLVGALATAFALRGPRHRPPEFPTVRYLTSSGQDGNPSAAPDGATIAFASQRDGRSRIWLKQVASGDEAALTAGPDAFPRFSPAGTTILFSRNEAEGSSLFAVGTLGGEPRRLVADAIEGDWSPDGRQVVFVRGVRGTARFVLGVVDLEAGGEREIGAALNRFLTSPRWSPDGRRIAALELRTQFVSGSPTTIHVFDVETGERRTLNHPGSLLGALGSSLAWSGDGQEILFPASPSVGFGAGTRLLAHRVDTAEVRTLLSIPDPVIGLDLLGAGRLVLHTLSWRQNLQEMPLAGPSAPRWLTRGRCTDRQPVYSPDGEWLVFTSDRMGSLDLWAMSRSSGAVRRLTHDPADDWDPAFTRDGKSLLWSSRRTGAFEIWQAAADGSAPRQLSHDGVDAANPSPTPDGAWIVYASSNPERTGLWKIRPDGSETKQLTRTFGVIPEVSPDGRHVLYIEQSALGTTRVLKVARSSDGTAVPFEIHLEVRERIPGYSVGRARWTPDGRAIAFVAQDAAGLHGVFVQDFAPGRDTSATRRPLTGFLPGQVIESFGFSPDGSHLAIAVREQISSLLLADGIAGVAPRILRTP